VVEAVNAISEHGVLEYTADGFVGSVNTAERVLGLLEISVTIRAVKDEPRKWEVVFKLPFEYNAAVAHIACGISRLKRGFDYQISTLAGDFKTRFEKIGAAIDSLEKRLTRLEEKHKHILKEEEEDYEEDDW